MRSTYNPRTSVVLSASGDGRRPSASNRAKTKLSISFARPRRNPLLPAPQFHAVECTTRQGTIWLLLSSTASVIQFRAASVDACCREAASALHHHPT